MKKYYTLNVLIIILIISCQKSNVTTPVSKLSIAIPDFNYKTDTTKISTIIFVNTSKLSTSYSWSFGDGKNSNTINPTHSYPNDGTYTVTLLATDSLNISSSTSQNVKVKSTKGSVVFYRSGSLQGTDYSPFLFQYGSNIWGQGIGGGELSQFWLNGNSPNCKDTIAFVIIQNVGTYFYMAKGFSNTWVTWQGTYNVAAAGCTKVDVRK